MQSIAAATEKISQHIEDKKMKPEQYHTSVLNESANITVASHTRHLIPGDPVSLLEVRLMKMDVNNDFQTRFPHPERDHLKVGKYVAGRIHIELLQQNCYPSGGLGDYMKR